ncbi:hypothetical protein F4824DRAFT_456147 [Ustulina deusta]|nr:hypothetical protein F4824DRAFT_456147 [Ustulina deusta]
MNSVLVILIAEGVTNISSSQCMIILISGLAGTVSSVATGSFEILLTGRAPALSPRHFLFLPNFRLLHLHLIY